MEQLGNAWKLVSSNLVEWLLLGLLAVACTVLSCGAFAVLAGPNAILVVQRAAARGGAPNFGDLFATEGWGARAVQSLVLVVVGALANLVPVVGLLFVGSALIYAPMLLLEGHYGVFSAMSASWHGAKHRLLAILLLELVSLFLWVTAMAMCVVPAFVVGPWILLAAWLDYDAHRSEILSGARAAGVEA